jgi:hypothetical protein
MKTFKSIKKDARDKIRRRVLVSTQSILWHREDGVLSCSGFTVKFVHIQKGLRYPVYETVGKGILPEFWQPEKTLDQGCILLCL